VSRAAAREYAVRLAAGGSLLLLALRGRITEVLVSGGGVVGLLIGLAWLVPGDSGAMESAMHAGIEGVVVGALAGVTLYAAGRAGVISFP